MTIRGQNGYFGYAKYLAHLRTLPPGEYVGDRANFNFCPIAQEIKRLVPSNDYVSVSPSRILYHINTQPTDHRHPLPAWTSDFITQIDNGGHSTEPVLAQEAIAAMERIRR
jgi:hypothetical protein